MLAGVRRALVEFVAPEVTSVYGRTELNYAINLVSTIARESEDAVANLVAENARLRRLLRQAGRWLANSNVDAALVAQLASVASPPRKPDLRLSALRAESAGLFGLFIRLQAACEDAPASDAAARTVHKQTMAFMRRRVEAQAGSPRR